MGAIADAANTTYRDYVVDGVPASGPHKPDKSDIRSLFGLLDGLFDWVELEDFGGGGSAGSIDNTPALNAAIAYCNANGQYKTIKLRATTYYFSSKPSVINAQGIILRGISMSETALIVNYNEADNNTGFITFQGAGSNGGGLVDLSIYKAAGKTGGTLVALIANAAEEAGFHSIERVTMSTAGAGADYFQCLLVNGAANQLPGGQGLRDLMIKDIFLFTALTSTCCADFINATNLMAEGVWANGPVIIDGIGTSLTDTTTASVGGHFLGGLYFQNCQYAYGSGTATGGLFFETTALDCAFSGVVPSGLITNLGTRCNAYASGAVFSAASPGYRKGSDGSIEQWGSATVGTSLASVSFPISFPAALLDAVACVDGTTASACCVGLATSSASAIQLAAAGASTKVRYRAIGH